MGDASLTLIDAEAFLAKAQESLASARAELASGRYNVCANRCYFACFQAVVSALLRLGLNPGSHQAAQELFARELINRRKGILEICVTHCRS